MTSREGRAGQWAIAAALLLGTLALYARVATFPFVHFDDNRYLTENPVVQGGLTWRGVAWAFTALHASNWHPLTWLSHMLDVQLFGMSAGAHHLVNAVLHAANASLLFAVLARMTGARWRSAVVAALFALHPLHVESVAWIAERKDVLSTLFGLLALHAYARYAEHPSARRYTAVAVLFALSLLAKPMWVTLPFLLLLLDLWPLRRAALPGATPDPERAAELPPRTWRQLAVEKLPLLALSVASAAVTLVAQHRGGALTTTGLGAWPRIANAATSYVQYVVKTVWPSSLSVFYPYHEPSAWEATVAIVVVLAATAAALAQARRRPWITVGWCWFVGTLVPVIGLVQVGGQALADRYTYLPAVGLFLAVVWTAQRAAAGWAAGARAALALAALVPLTAVTWRQLGYWSSHEALFRHALEVSPDSGVAHGALSEGLRADGRLEEALAHAREAVRVEPNSVRHWNNLGVSARETGLLAEAEEALQTAVRLEPGHAASWVNLGAVEADLGRPDQAAASYQRATELAPDAPEPWFRLGLLRSRAGRLDEATRCYEAAVARAPQHFGAWTNLAVLYQGAGRAAEAGAAFEAAAHAEPQNFVAWRNLGVYLAKTGSAAPAVTAYRRALRLRPDDPDVLRRLALTDLSMGLRDEALAIAARLDQLDPRAAAEVRGRAAEQR